MLSKLAPALRSSRALRRLSATLSLRGDGGHCGQQVSPTLASYRPCITFALLAGELLPALDDHVAIGGVDFHQERLAPSLFGGDQGRARSPEQIQHVLAGLGRILQARVASSTGFSVRWTIDCGLTFLTGHTSVALFGPKNLWPAPSRQP